MIRKMADATGPNAPVLATIPGVSLYAGYVTGSPGIIWTPGNWELFAPKARVMIDQGYIGAPRFDATVQDIEPGAWRPIDVPYWQAHCTAPRPTVYCNRFDLPNVLATGWTGNLWLADPGWRIGDPLPPAPGCTYVAVQNDFTNPAYDLSVVLDPTWPEVAMEYTVPGFPGKFSIPPELLIGADGIAYVVGYGLDGAVWYGKAGASAAVKLT